MIYLDNAATTIKKPDSVVKAVTEAMGTIGNASRGVHEGSLNSDRLIYGARVKLASFFNCSKPEQVIFTANSTEALNTAINGTIGKGDHVITTVLEHNSVLRPLYRLERERNVRLSFVNADKKGRIDYGDFERLIGPGTKAIVCTHASNLTGNVPDIRRIGEIAADHALLFIVDASQSAGSIDIDMKAAGISILCFTGHKSLMGPQGTGGLCIEGDIDVAPFKTGGTGVQSHLKEQPRQYPARLEAGTLNGHGIAGLSAAVDFINEKGLDNIHKREMELAESFVEMVKTIPGVRIYGDPEAEIRCPIVTINIEDMDSSIVADTLMQDYGIAVRSGAHCAPLMHEALGTTEQGAVRFSFGYFNTMEECEKAAAAVRNISDKVPRSL
ncbi:MAG: aminotransferase class V-fold PLP-dependent enzyme [Lachnospiraceae bacterium]|nr:aminotransferase class V-fold PLP-dependent enzyme [Lachnospiraceae bacterium]